MKAHFSKWSLFLNILLNQQQRNPPQSCTYARIQLIVVCPQRTNERCLQLSCGGSFIVLCHSWWSPVPPGCNRLICCLRTGVMHGCPLQMKEASAANAFKVMHLSSLRTFVDWPEEWWTPAQLLQHWSKHMHQLLIQTCFGSSFTSQMSELSPVLFLPLSLAHERL